jgi:hypothetical protein
MFTAMLNMRLHSEKDPFGKQVGCD